MDPYLNLHDHHQVKRGMAVGWQGDVTRKEDGQDRTGGHASRTDTRELTVSGFPGTVDMT